MVPPSPSTTATLLELGKAPLHPVDLVQEQALGHDHPGSRVRDHVLDLLRRRGLVDRERNRSQRHRRESTGMNSGRLFSISATVSPFDTPKGSQAHRRSRAPALAPRPTSFLPSRPRCVSRRPPRAAPRWRRTPRRGSRHQLPAGTPARVPLNRGDLQGGLSSLTNPATYSASRPRSRGYRGASASNPSPLRRSMSFDNPIRNRISTRQINAPAVLAAEQDRLAACLLDQAPEDGRRRAGGTGTG